MANRGNGFMNDTQGATAFIDPVCGMQVQEDAAHRLEHAGQTFRFCSAGCLAKFRADPGRYPMKSEAPQRPTDRS